MNGMNADRFQTLVDAYGADWRRWPEAEREAARAFSETAERQMFEARQVDAALDAFKAAPVSHDLRDRVIAMATQLALKPRSIRPFFGWAPRLGLAAACAAGVVVGLSATIDYRDTVQADTTLYQASLSGVDDTEFLG